MTDTTTGIEISTVRTGQVLLLADGTQTLATDDLVQVCTIIDGVPTGMSFAMTPEHAMEFATNLASRAGELLAERVDDSGKKLGLLAALRDLGKAGGKE
jgi:hypothetical protein